MRCCPRRYVDELAAKMACTGAAYRCGRCQGWHSRPAVRSRQRRFEQRLAARRGRT